MVTAVHLYHELVTTCKAMHQHSPFLPCLRFTFRQLGCCHSYGAATAGCTFSTQGLYLLNESDTFVEVARDVFVRIVVDKDLLVSQEFFVKARDNRASVQDVGDTTLLQRLQVSCSTDGTCKQVKPVSVSKTGNITYALTGISLYGAAK